MSTLARQIRVFEVRPRFTALYLVLVATAVLGLFAAGLVAPRLMREDGVFESAAALSFALGAVFGASLLFRSWRQLDPIERGIYGSAGVFAALAFLSEVSFGARLFDWSMPEMEGGGEFDGVHDLAIMFVRWARDANSTTLGVVLGLAAAGISACAWFLRRWIYSIVRRTVTDPVILGLAVSAVLLCAAVVLDTVSIRRAEVLEEALETVAGLNLLAAFVFGYYRRR